MSDSQEKTNLPTPKKLQDSRNKGEIVRSQEVNSAIIYLVLLTGIWSVSSVHVERSIFILQNLWLSVSEADGAVTGGGGYSFSRTAVAKVMISAWLILLVLPISIIAFHLVRRGIIFTGANIHPKLSRMSPLSGVKNKFGLNGIFDFLKGVIKSTIFVLILIYLLSPQLADLPGYLLLLYPNFFGVFFEEVFLIVVVVAAISIGLAIVDYAWQHHRFIKKNMMSQQELKDEFKESEGDPHFKAKRRQIGAELTSHQLRKVVEEADVVIVNPVHFAVALEWKADVHVAPIVTGIGFDHRALLIKRLAQEYGRPIYVDIPTARALATNLSIGDVVPQEHYAAVAAAIRFARDTFSKTYHA